MANFAPILEHTRILEGGWTIDQGGKTMFGITESTLKDYQAKTGRLSGVSIRNLTWPQASEIYKANYWTPIKGDLIRSQNLASAVFDYAVNSGVGKASMDLQRVLKALGYKVEIDGGIGPQTLKYANAAGERAVAPLMAMRKAFMESLAKKDPVKYGDDLKGWMNRLNRLQGFFVKAARPAGAGLVLAAGAAAYLYYKLKKGTT